jgi:hypothetical protein
LNISAEAGGAAQNAGARINAMNARQQLSRNGWGTEFPLRVALSLAIEFALNASVVSAPAMDNDNCARSAQWRFMKEIFRMKKSARQMAPFYDSPRVLLLRPRTPLQCRTVTRARSM